LTHIWLQSLLIYKAERNVLIMVWSSGIMNPDRAEEIIMGAIAVLMLSYLLPFSLVRNIFVTLFIAIGLIALLILRSISWHRNAITPFDGVLVVGICISVLYLFSFYAFQRNPLSAAVIVLFAIFYGLMAFLLYQHRWLFLQPRMTVHHMEYRSADHTHDPLFKRGIEPIPERAPPHHHHRRTIRTFFQRKATPEMQHHAHIEPIHEIQAPKAGKSHEAAFKRGMEPIHEITSEHLHKLGVYDISSSSKPKKRSRS
jgi:hypothetical protein